MLQDYYYSVHVTAHTCNPRRWRQGDHEFTLCLCYTELKASIGYMKPSLNKQTKNNINGWLNLYQSLKIQLVWCPQYSGNCMKWLTADKQLSSILKGDSNPNWKSGTTSILCGDQEQLSSVSPVFCYLTNYCLVPVLTTKFCCFFTLKKKKKSEVEVPSRHFYF